MHNNNKRVIRSLKRPLLILLAFCIVFVGIVSVSSNAMDFSNRQIEEKGEDYRKWAQGDPRWSDLPMGTSGKTVGKIGCLVTSVTKLLIQGGFKNSSSFNVGTYVTWLNSHGGLSSSGGLIWGAAAGIVNGFDYYDADWQSGYSNTSSMQNRILNYLRDGYHIVLNVKQTKHWVAVDRAKSLANGKVYIMDSLNNVDGNADIRLVDRYSYVDRISLFTGTASSTPNPTATPAPAPTPAPTAVPDYVDQCDYELVSVQARVTAQSATLYSQPCTSGNGSTVTGSASNGSILDLSAQVVNTSGENWYEVQREGGQHSYVNLQSVEFAGFVNDLEILPVNPPSGSLSQGSGYSLKEKIRSSHRLTSVTGRIVDQNGNSVKSVTLYPNTRGLFSIQSSQINSQLKFGELSAGHYSYEIIAEVTADTNMTSDTKVFRAVFVSPFSIGVSALPTHTVSFVDSITGETVGTQTVAHGFYAVTIDPPENANETFLYWSGADERIYADTVLEAVYSSSPHSGDVDGDGTISISDAIMIIRLSIGIFTQDADSLLITADVDGDGEITISDAVRTIRFAIAQER